MIVMLVPTVAELITGILFDQLLGIRLWDYTMQKYNFMGYICLKFSILFGVGLSLVMVTVFPPLRKGVEKLPKKLLCSLATPLFAIVLFDFFLSLLKH